MTGLLRWRVFGVVLAMVVACKKPPPPPPKGLAQVIEMAPASDEVLARDLADGIRVTFDKPAAPGDAIGRVVSGPSFAITPTLAGEARWIDARTLAYFPREPRSGQAYEVKLAPGLVVAAGMGVAPWPGRRLVFDRIRIDSVSFEGEREFQPQRPVLTLRLSHPVTPEAAAGCGFHVKDSGQRTRAVAVPEPSVEVPDGGSAEAVAQREERRRRLRVTPAEDLARGTAYLFRCGADLRPAAGGEGLLKPEEQELAVYGAPGIKQIAPARGESPADLVRVRIEFATPMPADEVRRRVTLVRADGATEPMSVAGDYRGVVFSWSGPLAPRTSYDLVIGDGLVDHFGQALPAGERRHTFKVGDASPRLVAQTGFFVVERDSGKYPIATRNLAQYAVRCAAVPDAQLPALLQGPGAEPRDWEEDDDGPAPAASPPDAGTAFGKLGLAARASIERPKVERNRWHDGALDLGNACGVGKPSGTYLIELATELELDHEGKVKPRTRRAIANVTDLGLHAKIGNTSSLIWVVRLSTGKPVAGAAITIRDLEGKVRFSGSSNPDGVLEAPGAGRLATRAPEAGDEEERGYYGPPRVIVTARAADDQAVLDTTWVAGLEPWNFDLSPDRTGKELRVRGFIHSDRGLYRPGETAHLRGILRVVDRAGRMSVPRKRKVHLVIEDPRGTALRAIDLTLSPFGGFHHDFVIDREARLGDYHARVEVDGFKVRERFAVEEYRPRTFEVTAKTGKKNVPIGRRISFDVAANYLYGAPLRAGKLRWSVRRRPYRPSFEGFDGFVFQDYVADSDAGRYWARYEDRSFTEPVADGELTLDKAGKAKVSARDPQRDPPSGQDYLFEATVEDASGQAVSATEVVTGHRADVYLGLAPAEYVGTAGKPFGVKLVAFDTEGKRKATTAKLSVTRRTFTCGSGGGHGGWHCEKRDDANPAASAEIAVPAEGGPALAELVPPAPGTYLLRAEAPDGRGGTSLATEFVYVTGPGEGGFGSEDGERMTVIASKTRYQPGEVARLVPQTQLPQGLALVTAERDGVMRYAVAPLADGGGAVTLPIEARFAPNVYAAVTVVRGRTEASHAGRPRAQSGLVALEIDPAARRLAVAVETDRRFYQPGEPVKARLKVASSDGKPVRAELAVAAADEGVLQIMGFRTPDPLPAFYARWDLGVDTATSWNRLIRRLDPDAEAAEGFGDGGGEEGGKVRSRFMATAFWNPAVVTRADGTAEVSFAAPDNLTAFRLMAVAADSGERFGSGEARFSVKKLLQAVPALPRFLNVGDEIKAAVLVHNNAEAALAGEISVEATGVELVGPASARFELAPGAHQRVEVGLRAKAEGEARLRFRARAGGETDAVDATLPVQRPVVRETLVLGEGEAETGKPVSLALPPLGDLVPGRGTLELVVDRTGLSRLDEGLGYLVGYPYGCLEQTTSAVVPMVALGELARTLPIPGVASGDLAGYVRAGVAKIIRHQHDEGGFGLWPGSSPELHYSAHALFGLRIAKEGGYAVPPAVMESGARFLKARLGEPAPARGGAAEQAGEAGARAFAHAVLASLGQADAGALGKLFEQRKSLPIDGRAFLLEGLHAAGLAEPARTLAAELAALAPPGDGPVVLREPERDLDWYWTSDLRSTALVLSALGKAAPGAGDVIRRLGAGLLGARVRGRWENTQENVHGLLALAALARTRAGAGESSVVVSLAGKAQPARLLRGSAIERVSLPLAALGPGPLALAVKGGGVTYAARLRLERPLGAAASDRGLAVARQLVDATTGAPVTRARLGQAIKVKLTVTAAGRQAYVALVDHLPAGLEPIITRFTPTDRAGEDDRAAWWSSWRTLWQHQELRDDRAQVFADAVAAGASTHEYLVRATTLGSFALPPATVEAMYEPAINGRSAAATLVVE